MEAHKMTSYLIKRELEDMIYNVAVKNSNAFRKSIFLMLENHKEDDRLFLEEAYYNIRKDYLDKCANEVYSTISKISPKIELKLQLVLRSPSMSGYDLPIENGLLAGSTFAICYWCLTDDKASPKDCVKLNHIHNKIMDDILYEMECLEEKDLNKYCIKYNITEQAENTTVEENETVEYDMTSEPTTPK